MLKSKIYLLSLVFLVAVPASAIRVIYTGGGYAEMVVINSFSALPKILKTYAQSAKGNQLLAGEKALIELALQDENLARVQVDFYNEKSPAVRYNGPHHISFSGPSLYDPTGNALSLSELWSRSFEYWAWSPHLLKERLARGINRSHIDYISRSLVKDMQQDFSYQVAEIIGQSLNQNIKLHVLSFVMNEIKDVALFAEWPEGSFDLTMKFKEALGCDSQATAISLRHVQAIDNIMAGKVQWRCGTQLKNAEMMIHFRPDLRLQSAVERLEVIIHSQRSKELPCEDVIQPQQNQNEPNK